MSKSVTGLIAYGIDIGNIYDMEDLDEETLDKIDSIVDSHLNGEDKRVEVAMYNEDEYTGYILAVPGTWRENLIQEFDPKSLKVNSEKLLQFHNWLDENPEIPSHSLKWYFAGMYL